MYLICIKITIKSSQGFFLTFRIQMLKYAELSTLSDYSQKISPVTSGLDRFKV